MFNEQNIIKHCSFRFRVNAAYFEGDIVWGWGGCTGVETYLKHICQAGIVKYCFHANLFLEVVVFLI